MSLSITTRPSYAPTVEFVERKGTGHPDTICDHLAEELARLLAREYLQRTGAVQHFNVDKAVLAAGTIDVHYGGGRHVTPARIILVGKADFSHGWEPPADELAAAAGTELAQILPDADPEATTIDVWLSQSAADLAPVVSGRGTAVPLANDTSFAAVSLPRSPLEEAVHSVESHLNSPEFRAAIPVGRDIKVMGARLDAVTSLTIAVPILARRVVGRSEYEAAVAEVRESASSMAGEILGERVEVRVNQADKEDTPYLTLSGSSGEAGDDGQVGRGNRFGGLITPYRPMSLEASAGKNPAAHVGKTYHAVAFDIATQVLDAGADETTVRLLSSIGSPVTEPQAVHAEIVGDVDDALVSQIVKESLADWDGVRDRLVAGQYELY